MTEHISKQGRKSNLPLKIINEDMNKGLKIVINWRGGMLGVLVLVVYWCCLSVCFSKIKAYSNLFDTVLFNSKLMKKMYLNVYQLYVCFFLNITKTFIQSFCLYNEFRSACCVI